VVCVVCVCVCVQMAVTGGRACGWPIEHVVVLATLLLEPRYLHVPIQCHGFTVRCVELASPKPGRVHSAGLEHAELVVGCHPSEFAAQHPHIDWDTKAVDKPVNADVSVSVAGGYSVKFHERPLYEVARSEVERGDVVPVPKDYFPSRASPRTKY
jgi:hypothetical protein